MGIGSQKKGFEERRLSLVAVALFGKTGNSLVDALSSQKLYPEALFEKRASDKSSRKKPVEAHLFDSFPLII
jgi:hypothetical protein